MQKIDRVIEDLSIPINTGPGSTPTSPAEGSCPICKGAGYLRVEVPLGHPSFGRLFPCQCKVREREERNLGELQRLSNLDAFDSQRFAAFNPRIAGVRDAYTQARQFAENPDGWLFLLGPVGCGKTHLAAAIANEAVERGLLTLFTVVPDLLDHLRATYAPGSPISYDERFEAIRTAPLLVLDDLGTENATSWATEKLYQIFNHRYNYRLPTVVTTNRDLDAIEERIRSRLLDERFSHVLLMRDAGDFRTRNLERRPKERRPTRRAY